MAWGALLVLLCAATAGAAAARLKSDATLRAKPSETSDAVGKVSAGTRVDVLSESGGWHEVKAPAGRGFVRGEQLVLGELAEPAAKSAEKKPATPASRAEAEREADRAAAEQLQQLTDEVRLLRERPEPVTAADLQRVEQALTQAISGTCENRAAPAATPPPADPPLPDTSLESVLAVSPVLLLVGGVVGWIAGRVSQRRRDHRNRIRV
jgi:uncharacterized protein YgiM (DUF1202 family)